MKLFTILSASLALAMVTIYLLSVPLSHGVNSLFKPGQNAQLQDIVTWDEKSLFIRGERVMIFAAEFHPYRLPVPSLWTDIFQKIKAMGFNTVSFYINWSLLEGTQGVFRAENIFSIEAFVDAAKQAGMYLLVRPGPYIAAESTGGGMPGWVQRVPGSLRTNDMSFLDATNNYIANVAGTLSAAQITNGGPVILWQVENEYTNGLRFPEKPYFAYIKSQILRAGIVVPLINNDAEPDGNEAPNTGVWSVDVYGHDGYPLGFNCANPDVWPDGGLPTDWHSLHDKESPNTPYTVVEFQAGSFDSPGGPGEEQCAILTNEQFERVFYKNNVAAGVRIMGLYMIYGGTNWGNIPMPGVYTSYDYGASIRENRAVDREKYSELKLEAQFMKVSPNYLVTSTANLTTGVYSKSTAITITPLLGKDTGSFFVTRHTNYSSLDEAFYALSLPTSIGMLSIPQLGGMLTLNGRDSKIHVTDYPVGDKTLLYSTAEVFTWKEFSAKTVLILYGEPNELHEVAVKGSFMAATVEGAALSFRNMNDTVIFQFQPSTSRQVAQIGNLEIYLLDRKSAYKYWVPTLPNCDNPDGPEYGSSVMNPEAVIINGGYLVRSVAIRGFTLSIQADFDNTTHLEIIGVPSGVSSLVVNSQTLQHESNHLGNWVAIMKMIPATVRLPELSSLNWYSLDSLPEIRPDYSDAAWPGANLTFTYNTANPLKTPVSLYAADYHFDSGALIFRGHFTALGTENELFIETQGGGVFASSVWLDGDFLGSITAGTNSNKSTYTLPPLRKGEKHALTVLVDNMGLEEITPGVDQAKQPRGILDYALQKDSLRTNTSISWKITGNLGGEDYADKFRGPLNEDGFYFERQGYHLPDAPTHAFKSGSPFHGMDQAGLSFYAANFPLSILTNQYDIPVSFNFDPVSVSDPPYRALLFVNGFQFGKYLHNVGPQVNFPVPEGILNYNGDNWLGLAIWALSSDGAQVSNFSAQIDLEVMTGRPPVEFVNAPGYEPRPGAY